MADGGLQISRLIGLCHGSMYNGESDLTFNDNVTRSVCDIACAMAIGSYQLAAGGNTL